MENIPALIEAAKSIQDNKGFVAESWGALMTKLVGKKSTIIFTGLPGAGKTTLLDKISGKTELPDYKPPGRSVKIEKGLKKVPVNTIRDEPKKRLAYVVIPGQESSVRQRAFEELFKGDEDVAGVVHVVSGGLPTLRERVAIQVMAEQGVDTIEKFRKFQVANELDDLDSVCDALERYMTISRKPLWLILVVNKADLFAATINHEIDGYIKATSPFAERLRLLQNRVGSLYFDWDIAPVSAYLEDFTFQNQTVESTLKPLQQQQYVKAFVEKLIERC